MFDSHNHIDLVKNMVDYARMCQNYNLGIFAVGTTPRAFEQEVGFLHAFNNVKVGLGYHPQLVGSGYDDITLFEKLIYKSRYIGEVGLDFSKEFLQTKDRQIKAFERVIHLCENAGDKVISVHSLKAVGTVLDIIEKNKQCNGNIYILHWYTGSVPQLRRAIRLGCYFSINPKMLKTKSGFEIIKEIPIERMLIETDAPFAVSHNDVRMLASSVEMTIRGISDIKKSEIRDILSDTEQRIFG